MSNYQQAELRIAQGPGADNSIPLSSLPVVIGRVAAADITIDDPSVSRQHARISQHEQTLVIEDLQSSNGVFVNGERVTGKHVLKDGDEIGLGPKVVFHFNCAAATVMLTPEQMATMVVPVGNDMPTRKVAPPPRLIITLANGASSTHNLLAESITLGRAETNDIPVGSLAMSRQHLRLTKQGADYLVASVPAARNKPLLAGVVVADGQPLYDQDEVVVGADVPEHVVRLRYESATAVALLPPPSTPPPPPRLNKAQIDQIVGQKNLLVRNLQITQGYHDVAHMLGGFLTFRNVNWFAFGTYASKTAGRAIRHESLPRALKSALIRSAGYDNTYLYLNQVLAQGDEVPTAENVLSRVLQQVSLILSLGNLMIFGELAWPFVDMVTRFGHGRAPEPARFNAFLDEHFIPGQFDDGGQDWLRESLASFYEARFEPDPKRNSELIFRGNILLALHEQSRLQDPIEKALATPFDLFTEGIIPNNNQEIGWFRSKFTNRAVDFSRDMVLRSVTRMVMAYTLPHKEMKLGQDVVAPTGLVNFPMELLLLEDERCREITQRFDPNDNTLAGSGAGNWGKLDDRMRFIIDFFRSYQREKRLFEPPFTEDQVAAIKAGLFPGGTL